GLVLCRAVLRVLLRVVLDPHAVAAIEADALDIVLIVLRIEPDIAPKAHTGQYVRISPVPIAIYSDRFGADVHRISILGSQPVPDLPLELVVAVRCACIGLVEASA